MDQSSPDQLYFAAISSGSLETEEPTIPSQDPNLAPSPPADVFGYPHSSVTTETLAESIIELAETPIKTFQICDESAADLIVQLETDGHVLHYHVCRSILSISSPVFSRMVDTKSRLPSTKKRKRGSETAWYLDLHDDDPEALLLLFRAMHIRAELIPAHVEFEQLFSIAILCDKYDCARPLLPYKDKWLDYWSDVAMVEGHEGWLHICVVFGETRNFADLTWALIIGFGLEKVVSSSGGNTPSAGGQSVRSHSRDRRVQYCVSRDGVVRPSNNDIPEKLLQDILRCRKDALVNLHSIASKFLQSIEDYGMLSSSSAYSYTSSPSSSQTINRRGTSKDRSDYQKRFTCTDTCTATCYGIFVLHARRMGLWDYLKLDPGDPKVRSMTCSPSTFYKALLELFNLARSAVARDNLGHIAVCGQKILIRSVYSHIVTSFQNIVGLDPKDYMHYREKGPAAWETIELPRSQEQSEQNKDA